MLYQILICFLTAALALPKTDRLKARVRGNGGFICSGLSDTDACCQKVLSPSSLDQFFVTIDDVDTLNSEGDDHKKAIAKVF